MNYLIIPGILIITLIVFYRITPPFSYFNDKEIIITGASSGIGKSIAEILQINSNCKLHLLARSFKNTTLGNVRKYKCDCSDYKNVENIMSNIEKIDILIHSAGTGD